MYLTEDDRTGILIEMIMQLDDMVDERKVSPDSAFYMIVAQAKEHPKWGNLKSVLPAPVPTPEPVRPLSLPIQDEVLKDTDIPF